MEAYLEWRVWRSVAGQTERVTGGRGTRLDDTVMTSGRLGQVLVSESRCVTITFITPLLLRVSDC